MRNAGSHKKSKCLCGRPPVELDEKDLGENKAWTLMCKKILKNTINVRKIISKKKPN